MNKLRETLKELKVSESDLTDFMWINPQRLEDYITLYEDEAYPALPVEIKRLFDLICKFGKYYKKNDILAMCLVYEFEDELNEMHPFRHEIKLELYSKNLQALKRELKRNEYHFEERGRGGVFLGIAYGTLDIWAEVTIKQKRGDGFLSKYDVDTIQDIMNLLEEFNVIYKKVSFRAKQIKDDIKKLEGKTDEELKDIPTPDDLISPPNGSGMSSLKTETVKREIIKKKIANNIRYTKGLFLRYAMRYEIEYMDKHFAVITDRCVSIAYLCLVTPIFDPTSPFKYDEDIIKVPNSSEFTFNVINVDEIYSVKHMIEVAKYLSSIINTNHDLF